VNNLAISVNFAVIVSAVRRNPVSFQRRGGYRERAETEKSATASGQYTLPGGSESTPSDRARKQRFCRPR
jgi:hypothetical protein